ncbi:hypothetical protein ACFO6R_05915 [Eubacterium multiforme]|uniref:Uncharacterized protein n=1 Tax=Eubacterium multiforme TaxID=83339 RepID=A0ABT9US33_9FIRM|nr:hypothetical protein [Eubacterium multiforme]MDQ0149119.1 hypothetical protein [Eubacterium multiforme]
MENEVKVNVDIQENVTINGTVNLKNEEGNVQPVMYLTCTLNADSFGLNVNVNVVNKELYKSNSTEVKTKYAEFKALVAKRAEELNYIVF